MQKVDRKVAARWVCSGVAKGQRSVIIGEPQNSLMVERSQVLIRCRSPLLTLNRLLMGEVWVRFPLLRCLALEARSMKKLSHKDAAIILQTNVSQGSCFDILLRDCDLGPEAGVGALFGVEPFPDRVLANIQGSSYEWFYEFADESFRFYRLPQPYNLECGLFAFVWPEDRCLMDGAPGRYWRKDRTDSYLLHKQI